MKLIWKPRETLCKSLHWRHNGHDRVSNHQPHGCLLNRLFRRRSREIWKLLVTERGRRTMMTSSNGNIFRVPRALCVGNSSVTGKFSAQTPVTRSFHVFCDLRLNKRLSKQSWGRWSENPSRPSSRHYNASPKTPVAETTFLLLYLFYAILCVLTPIVNLTSWQLTLTLGAWMGLEKFDITLLEGRNNQDLLNENSIYHDMVYNFKD